MKPYRSQAHLDFIRSLPCSVSGRRHSIEAAHVGARGMGQKSSDLETIPLNALYHREQHRVGLKKFAATYDLDIPAILAMLTEKPDVSTLRYWDAGLDRQLHSELFYVANYAGDFMRLAPVRDGLPKSLAILKDRVRESLTERILARVKSFQAH
jgi:hypothetical protein